MDRLGEASRSSELMYVKYVLFRKDQGAPPSPYGLGLNEYVWSFSVTPAPRLYPMFSQTGSTNPRISGGVVPVVFSGLQEFLCLDFTADSKERNEKIFFFYHL